MNFENILILGKFIKRYKRFFADVKVNNNIIKTHCPNTGSMMGLLNKGNRVWISKSGNPNRKLSYTLQIIESNKSKVGINTHFTNKIVLEALSKKMIKTFENYENIKTEFKFGDNTRFDFLVTEKNKKSIIEVKNVTLSRDKGIAEFPDAITSRGLKHLNELLKAYKKGFKIYLLFLIQREDCKTLRIAGDIDPEYRKLIIKAIKNKLNVLCYDCKFTSKGIKLNQQIEFRIV